jgi:hypothetical protein
VGRAEGAPTPAGGADRGRGPPHLVVRLLDPRHRLFQELADVHFLPPAQVAAALPLHAGGLRGPRLSGRIEF